MSRSTFKPVSFSTTLRNPLRVWSFLSVISKHEGSKLSDTTILEIEKQLIKQNLYKPLKKPQSVDDKRAKNEDLSDDEVEIIVKMNPQTHKEKGFAAGWPSRFATHYNMLMEMGLVIFSPNEKIIITKKAKQLLKGESDLISTLAHSIKHIRLGNKYKPGTLNKQQVYLTYLRGLKISGSLSSEQFYALACSKDSSVESVQFLLNNNDKMSIEKHWGSEFNKNAFERSKETIDDLSRKLFLTGVFKIEKSPDFRFSLKDEFDPIELISAVEDELSLSEVDYLTLMTGEVFDFIETSENISAKTFIEHWDAELSLDECIDIFSKCNTKAKIENAILSYVPKFVLFEMMTALILYKTNPGSSVDIHLHYDDNMTPTAAASGGTADIEFEFNGYKTNVEVTLLTGVAQNSNESQSTLRHLVKSKADSLLFIAPNISRDLAATYQFEILRRDLKIGALSSKDFIGMSSNKDPKGMMDISNNVLKNKTLVDDNLALRVNNILK